MNAGSNFKKAQAQAQANANLTGTPRYLHVWGGDWWIETEQCFISCETVQPERKETHHEHIEDHDKRREGTH